VYCILSSGDKRKKNNTAPPHGLKGDPADAPLLLYFRYARVDVASLSDK